MPGERACILLQKGKGVLAPLLKTALHPFAGPAVTRSVLCVLLHGKDPVNPPESISGSTATLFEHTLRM